MANYINIVAGKENKAAQRILNSNLSLGLQRPYKNIGVVTDRILDSDVSLGNTGESILRGDFYKDRAPNAPSGWTPAGVPTFGDGKLNTTTTFAADYARSKANSKFEYFLPFAIQSKKFSSLT